jgi:hypothetical protein
VISSECCQFVTRLRRLSTRAGIVAWLVLSPSQGARKNRVADNPQNDKAKHAQQQGANTCDKFVPIKIVSLPYIHLIRWICSPFVSRFAYGNLLNAEDSIVQSRGRRTARDCLRRRAAGLANR